jgi:hypothetical protein
MDHSFVGMTGGQIFHEMMLRQGVKHICTFPVSAEQREEKRREETRRDAMQTKTRQC